MGVRRGDCPRLVNRNQSAGDVGDQALAQSLGAFGAAAFKRMQLRQLALLGLKLLDQRLKGFDDEFALAYRRRRMYGTVAGRFDHAPIGTQKPAHQHINHAQPKDQRDQLIAEEINNNWRVRRLTARPQVEAEAQADEQQ